ncbi:hypothetical protein JR316_0010393 [Psilocybe cubensis]|uniref:Uncharacterized protein n=1 Tax=Psilocybe cubensis TaxID=181762 RepID=A0ACB8GLD1_PSICU|nr:hypothetical protein JR316_0010393 [Psilocybe cubensis]KAH9476481.1 hypothetical protein JR316_0010393 [Psilocybe cubensis]
MRLIDLPPELLIQTFSFLPPADLLSCQLSCTFLNSIVHNSLVLQYGAALVASGTVDNPCSILPLSSKLSALRDAERAWAKLSPTFTKRIKVSEDQCGVYDLSGGVYLLSNAARRELMYLRLPTTKQEARQATWHVLSSKKTIIDIGLCLFEHDLIVIVSTTPSRASTPSQPLYDIEMQYLQFSTGLPHPRAVHKNAHVMSSPWEKPAIGIEIVGENLVLILTFINRGRTDDRVFIYDWMSDVVKVSFLAPHRSYSGLLFLTPNLILLPNTTTNSLDIFRIPEKPTLGIPQPVLILRLPELADERVMGGITCRAEPNPVGEGWWAGERARSAARLVAASSESASTTTEPGATTESLPTRPFLPPPASAICLFEIRVLALRLHLHHGAWNMGLEFRDRFTFVVRREGFVRLVEKCGEFGEGEDAETSTATTNEPTASNEPQNQTQQPAQQPPTQRTPPTLPYASWGPPITRWFNSDRVSSRWITVSAGERLVRMEDRPDNWVGEGLGGNRRRRRRSRTPPEGGDANADGVEDEVVEVEDEEDIDEDEADDFPRFMRPFTVVDFRPEFVERVAKVYDAAEAKAKAEAEAKRQEEEEMARKSGEAEVVDKGKGKRKQDESGEEEDEKNGSKPFVRHSDWMPLRMRVRDDDEEHGEEVGHGHEDHSTQQDLPSQPQYRQYKRRRAGVRSRMDTGADAGEGAGTSASVQAHDNALTNDEEEIAMDTSEDEGEWHTADEGEHEDGYDYAIVIDDDSDDEENHYIIGGVGEDDDEDEDQWTDTEGDGEHFDGAMGMEHTGLAIASPFMHGTHQFFSSPPSPEIHPIPRMRLLRGMDTVEPADAFAEHVEGGLPCVQVESEREWGFDGVLMDEERVVGVYTNEDDRIEQVEILYFG